MITPNSKYMMREEQEYLQKNKELINSASASSLAYDKNRLKNVQFQEKFEKEILVSTNQIQRKNKVLYSQSQQNDINNNNKNNNSLHKSSSSALVLSSKNILQPDLQNFDKYKDVHSENYENLMKIGIIKQKEFKEPPNLKDKTEQVKRIQEIQSQMTNLTPLAKDGDYDVITDHKSMMREHRKEDFSSNKISNIILNYYPRIMGEQQIFFRIDLIDNIPPEYWSIQFMMGLLLKISDKKSTLFRQKHKQVITTNSESIKYNNCVLGYKDELNIIKNPDFYLYFEINGVKSDNTTEKLAWTVQPLFNARGEIIFGKFKLPFYTFTQKVTTQLHLKLRQTYKPQLYYWVAKEESQQFKENKLISKNQYHIGKLHQLIQEQQNKTSQVDVPRIMKYAENTTDYILGMPDTDVGDINNLRGQIARQKDRLAFKSEQI
ncbi:hypothetical protein PPERSA_06451 [Pseudocohnilembus persalinus]|uniref:Uncharacterized protein n=1 Tax=Pseudocohnilembus persalinus TaxID=266149 RepID=A0A0V0QRJ7_PSEPJ|nr:hypothetical protein PPERSA_06451 [Pseudocohnilembus persalinus]|eukprot:KRX04817.1 hypothetical protein PPERSA_06451 [Pseudocohnilembus persalinus]